jgi:GNAT superfamily N-acetyltransferase
MTGFASNWAAPLPLSARAAFIPAMLRAPQNGPSTFDMPDPEFHLIELRELKTQEPSRYRELFDAFAALYRAEFTDRSECEDPEAWHARLGTAPAPEPRMYITVACSIDTRQPPRVLGGIAYEYYAESRCALVTYLVVDAEARQRGLGARLLAAAQQRLQRDASAQDALRAVFAEAEIPDRLADVAQRSIARKRLAILAALGACKVAIEYVQPELQAGAGRADRSRPTRGVPDRRIDGARFAVAQLSG